MNTDEFWTILNRKKSLAYPYSPQRSIFPESNDPFKRVIRRLLNSFKLLGKKLVEDPELATDERTKLSSMIRILEGGLEFRDFKDLIFRFGLRSTKTSKVIICQRDCPEDDDFDWRLLRQVVILQRISSTKAAVYFITTNTGVVDVYAIGPTENVELQQFGLQILSLCEKVLPNVKISFAYHFQIPRSFENDVLMMALILTLQLHHHGKYLHLTRSILYIYKLKAFEEFNETHDKWLRSMRSANEYPFVVEKLETDETDDDGKLCAKGWRLIDVPGDGNCGYFCCILGLENYNKKLYNPRLVDETGQPIDPDTSKSLDIERSWQTQVLRIRRDLRDHSVYLTTKKYKRGQEPDWWCFIGPLTQQDKTTNHASFYTAGKNEKFYFKGKLDAKHQMMSTWGPFVFSCLFKMRVIVINRFINQNREGAIIDDWYTWIFARGGNVAPIQQFGIYRMPDDEFRKHPTIELFYTGGQENLIDNHFQFLSRVYCDNVTPFPTELNDETLLSYLKQRRKAANLKDAPKTGTAENVTTKEASHGPNQPRPEIQIDDSNTTNDLDEDEGRKLPGVDTTLPPTPMEVDVAEKEKLTDNDPTLPRPEMEVNDLESEKVTDDDVGHPSHLILPQSAIQVDDAEKEMRPDDDPTSPRPAMEANDSERENPSDDDDDDDRHQTHPKLPRPSIESDDKEILGDEMDDSENMIEAAEEVDALLQKQDRLNRNVSQGKTPRKRLSSSKPSSVKRQRHGRGKELREYDAAYFNAHFWAGTMKHDSPARMKYDSVLGTFWVCFAAHKRISQEVQCDDIDTYDAILVNQARRIPDVWHGCSIGDSIECSVPSHLTTNVPILYQQFNSKFCLTYSLSSALFYCGFDLGARILNTQARVFASLLFDEQLNRMKDLMLDLVPLIGRPTIYIQRRCNNKKKKAMKRARAITWDSLFNDIVPHPTLVVPVMPDGKASHAFCIVDDLIFESSFPFALKLQRDSIEWIYGDPDIEIFQVFRFNMKCSPKGHKVEGIYSRDVTLNWKNPSRVFIQRDSSTWNLPHYIIESKENAII
jgi:hypothetical protein